MGLGWTRDGTELIVTATLTGAETDLWVLALDSPDTAVNLSQTPGFDEVDSSLSPDHSMIALGVKGATYVADVSQPWSLGPPSVLLDSKNQVRFPAWRPVP